MPRRYTLDDLRTALARDDVRTMADLCRALGLVPRGANYETIRNAAREAGVDLSEHLEMRRTQRWDEVPDESAVVALRFASTIGDAIRSLDREPTTGSYRHMRRIIERYDIDVSHMDGRAWARGRERRGRRRPIAELLVSGRSTGSVNLRRRLIDEGFFEARCSSCGRDEWEGEPIPLELDHIDGDRRNNRLDNLRLLCPNCHALTPTYRGRNIGNGAR